MLSYVSQDQHAHTHLSFKQINQKPGVAIGLISHHAHS